MRQKEIEPALGALRAVDAELAQRPLERGCQAHTGCCQFQLTGRPPQLTQGEALVARLKAERQARIRRRSSGLLTLAE